MGSGGAFDYYLAQEGFIVVCVDGRGTGARGAEFEKCTYLRLVDLESKDQVETAEAEKSRSEAEEGGTEAEKGGSQEKKRNRQSMNAWKSIRESSRKSREKISRRKELIWV